MGNEGVVRVTVKQLRQGRLKIDEAA